MAETAVLVDSATKIKVTDTVATIKALLDLLEIPFPSGATKAELLALVPKGNLAEPAIASVPGPLSERVLEAMPDIVSGAVETEPTDYVVQPGDTIASVATRYGMSVAKLKALNTPLKLKFKPGCVLRLV